MIDRDTVFQIWKDEFTFNGWYQVLEVQEQFIADLIVIKLSYHDRIESLCKPEIQDLVDRGLIKIYNPN